MKPVSIIFLIVSVFLVIVGMLLCGAGMVKANIADVPLYDYAQTEDGDAENEYTFDESDVSRIKIDVDGADVTVVCGAAENKVTVKNITSNNIVSAFDCIINNRTMSIENHNLFSLTSLAQGQFKFKGFRYGLKNILDGNKYSSKNKEIVVYVKELCDLKNLDITVGEGNITLQGYDNSTDYTLYTSNGDIKVSGITTDSSLTAQIKNEGNITLDDVSASVCDIDTVKGEIDIAVSCDELKCNNGDGNTVIRSQKSLDEYNYNIASPMGKISINGEDKGSEYKSVDGMLTCYMRVTSANGNVTVASNVTEINPDN